MGKNKEIEFLKNIFSRGETWKDPFSGKKCFLAGKEEIRRALELHETKVRAQST